MISVTSILLSSYVSSTSIGNMSLAYCCFLALLVATVHCQSGVSSALASIVSSVTSTSSVPATSTHTIEVSKNDSHAFDPATLKAEIGDIIEVAFSFLYSNVRQLMVCSFASFPVGTQSYDHKLSLHASRSSFTTKVRTAFSRASSRQTSRNGTAMPRQSFKSKSTTRSRYGSIAPHEIAVTNTK